MSDFEKIDKNFKVETKIDKTDVVFFDPRELPFRIYGVYYDNGQYRRLPSEVAKSVSEGVYALHANTAGGRIRFMTDSPYVAIKLEYGEHVTRTSNASITCTAGLDLYVRRDGVFCHTATFLPSIHGEQKGIESVAELGSSSMREIIINMPSYADVISIYIGLSESARVERAEEYSNSKPVVFYGSSITQGGCASRPGLIYQNIISRRFNLDYINLGFSGSAKGEDEIADYIKGLDTSLFVYDYDHNAPSPEHLEATHLPLYRRVREKNPDLPIVFMTRPTGVLGKDRLARRAVIKKTYDTAVSEGDKNVYFLDPTENLPFMADEGTVEACHPNDLGFYFMAKALFPILEPLLPGEG